MASEKNLNAVFTDIANAIRAKKGTTAKMQPINMADEIANLPSGGGDIDWAEIGYDGTPQVIIDGFEHAKKIASEWDNAATSADSKYRDDNDLVFFPLVDTSNVTNMRIMFYGCSSLITIPQLDTSNVTNMYLMFSGCGKLKIIPQLDTSKVTNMGFIFENCINLKSILMTGMKVNFSISASTKFEESDLVTILNNLATVTSTKTLTMGSTNLAKLTDEEKAIATNKGWTLA